MKSTALLTGPYDWDPALLPCAEFEARVAMVRSVMPARGVKGLLVYGDSAEHGNLAYLTGFTPKLGPAFAFLPTDGPLRLLVSGSASMLAAAKRLTWVEDVIALGDPRKSLAEWLHPTMSDETARLGLWGSRAMIRRMHSVLAKITSSSVGFLDLDDSLDRLRRHKSPIEREMIVRACRILSIANDVFALSAAEGRGARSAAIDAERAAFHAGAQDIRILASARDGGPPLPFYGAADPAVSPVLVCVAVRFAGYWAEGSTTIGCTKGGALAHAEAALAAMLGNARAGMSFRELANFAHANLGRYRVHPFVQANPCSSIGLSLDEPSDSLEDGGVYTLSAGAAGGDHDNAVVSAMIAITNSRIEILWGEVSQ